jgi:multiple sugar transport system substrate-binding protein
MPKSIIPSGNTQLDELLGGGMLPHRIYHVSGHTGTGKTTLALQFLLNTFKPNSNRLFISLREESVNRNGIEVYEKRTDAKKPEIQFKYIPALTLPRIKTIDQIKKQIAVSKPGRLVIDDIHLLATYPDMNIKLYWDLVEYCRGNTEVTLTTGTVSYPSNSSEYNFAPLLELSDGIICLRYEEQRGKIDKKIYVLKHRDLLHETAVRNYTIYAAQIMMEKKVGATPDKPVEQKKESGASTAPVAPIPVIPDILYFDAEQEKMVHRRITEYNAQHPESPVQILGKKIESVYDYNLLIDKFEKGETPFTLLPIDLYRLPQLAEQGLIHPLDNLFTPDLRDLYLDVALQQCRYKGVLYAIPQYINVSILAYRKDLLDKYHCAPPRTWAELVKTAQTILENEADPELKGLGFQGSQFENLSCNFLEFLWCNGGDVFDAAGKIVINSEAAIEALKFMQDLIYKYHLAPEDTPYLAESQTERLFLNRHLVYLRSWPRILSQANWDNSRVKDKVGFVPLPIGPHGSKSIPIIGGHGYMIPKKVAQPEIVWRFLDELLSPDAVVDFAIKGWTCPVRKSAYTNTDVLMHRPYYTEMLSLLPTGRARQQIPHYPVVTQLIKREIHFCLRNEQSPKETLDTMAHELHKTIHRQMHTPPIARAIEYIETHLNQSLDRDTIADIVHLSPSHFSVLFKEVIGQTFTEYLTHLRIERAKNLLGNPEYNIEQIAEKVGFSDESYFTLVFKKLTGVTPSRYRLNLQGMIASL